MIKYFLKLFLQRRIEELKSNLYSLTVEIEYAKDNSEDNKNECLKSYNKINKKIDSYKMVLEDL